MWSVGRGDPPKRGFVFHIGERLKKGEGCYPMILVPAETDTTAGISRAAPYARKLPGFRQALFARGVSAATLRGIKFREFQMSIAKARRELQGFQVRSFCLCRRVELRIRPAKSKVNEWIAVRLQLG